MVESESSNRLAAAKIPSPETHVMRSKYYAIGTDRLLNLMRRAGFASVERLDAKFYQPVLVGTREV